MAEPLPPRWVAGLWSAPGPFLTAVAAARDARFPRLVAYAPWPVHGLEAAAGHPPSWIGRAALLAVVAGGLGCSAFFYHSSVLEWPINVSGKPYFAPQFWLVPILEAALLTGAVVTFLSCGHACRFLPGQRRHPDPRVTDDQCALLIAVDGERYTEESLSRWLQDHGAERLVYGGGSHG
ncbi:MAG: DUF3341 domain-containing protein [Planctomycetota bacterium]|nr:DUF3341 domain-containing protein [Planctomycetota bacterium]MCX8039877.1 DUF3341 domain-containing protein [Planctomycetota bacterium]MDW8372164.1 DUF3341 domain-containing protein [Planctomycetota bacterium]